MSAIDFKINVYRPSDLSNVPGFVPAPWSVITVHQGFAGPSMHQPSDMPDTIWEACLLEAENFRATPSLDACTFTDHYWGLVLVRAYAKTGEAIVDPNTVTD
jgi:hypothetical protein